MNSGPFECRMPATWQSIFLIIRWGMIPCLILPACNENLNQGVPQDGNKILVGQIKLPEGSSGENFSIQIIPNDGIARPAPDLRMDPQGFFSFKLPRSFVQTKLRTEAEGTLTDADNSRLESGGFFEAKGQKVTLEAISNQTVPTGSFLLPYRQFSFDLSESNWLSKKPISLPLVELEQVGYKWLTVADLDEKPIVNAEVLILNLIDESQKGDQIQEQKGYRPHLLTTGTDGRVLLYPIFQSDSTGRYRIQIKKNGFCSYTSDFTQFKVSQVAEDKVTLKICEDPASKAIEISSKNPDQSGTETILDSPSTVLYTNNTKIRLNFTTALQPYGETTLEIFEGFIKDPGEAALLTKKLALFHSELEVELPDVFPSSGTTNGVYTLFISTTDGYKGRIYGKKNTIKPDYSFTEDLKFLSLYEIEGLISGKPEGVFRVFSEKCDDGYQFAINLPLREKVYSKCKESMAEFEFAKLGADALTSNGLLKIEVSLVDRFGNETSTHPNQINIFEVFYDIKGPVQSDLGPGLGSDFGLIFSNRGPYGDGTINNSFDFNAYRENDEPINLKQVGDNVEVSIAFASTNACLYYPEESQEEVGENDQGRRIGAFVVNTQETKPENWFRCSKEETAQTHPASLPGLTTGPVFLHLLDGAGNYGGPFKIELQDCDKARTYGDLYCVQ